MITNQMKNEIMTNFTIQYRYFSSSLIYNAHLIRKSINNNIGWCSKIAKNGELFYKPRHMYFKSEMTN